ncbi:MAG: transposase [Bacteroidota bacterium]
MDLNKIYFYTASIYQWKPLLLNDDYKDIIIRSLSYLVKRRKIVVYAFVIMPNHIHIIWELISLNGKEMPHASFMKFVSHEFLQRLRTCRSSEFDHYRVEEKSRNYRFWNEKPMSVFLYTPNVIYQKLDYIHNNPVQGKWSLSYGPLDYRYSSARFYEDGIDEFGFLSHIGERI